MSWLDSETVEKAARDGFKLDIEENNADPNALFRERIERLDEVDYVVVTDATDADGLGCAVLYRHKWGDNVAILPAGYGAWGPDPVADENAGRYPSISALDRIGETIPNGVPIYITDLGQNESDRNLWMQAIGLMAMTNPVYFRDHHETPEDLRTAISSLSNVEYAHYEDRAATKIVLKEDYPDAPDYLHEFAEYTNARDLYLTDTEEFEKGEVLTNAAFWLPFEEYVTAAVEHGVNIDNHPEFGEIVEKRTELRDRKLDWVMENKEIENVAGYRMGTVYGDCYHSEAGRRLIENHDVDIAAIIKPSGKTSWRTAEDTPVAKKLAEELGGGGHEHAAGCSPFDSVEIDEGVEDPTEYASGERKTLKRVVRHILGD